VKGYEYREIRQHISMEKARKEALRTLGKEGWELVSSFIYEGIIYLFFKREK
jgi:hypothetical protein